MQKYQVKFTRIMRYSRTVIAATEYEAMAEAVKAFYRGDLEPEYSALDHFEAEAKP